MAAQKEIQIEPDCHLNTERINNKITEKPLFFHRGNNIRFEISPKANGEDVNITQGTLHLEIKGENRENSIPFVAKSLSSFLRPLRIEINSEESSNIPAGFQRLIVWLEDGDDELTFFSGNIEIKEDGVSGQQTVVLPPPDRYERQSNKGRVNGYASLDDDAKVPVSQLPDEALTPEFNGTFEGHFDLSHPIDDEIQFRTSENDGFNFKATRLRISNSDGTETQDILPTDDLEKQANKGQNDGYAALDSTGKVPESQLPDSALVPAFDGNLTSNIKLNPSTGTEAEIATTKEDGLALTGSKIVFRNEDGTQITELIPGADLRGPQGERGATGDRGRTGLPGLDGRDGIDGRDGKDAVLPDNIQLTDEKGMANGYAGLDANSMVPSENLPSPPDISGLQETSEKGQNDGYAALDSTGKVPVAQLPDSALVEAPDLTAYQQTSEKGMANGYAGLDANGRVPITQLNYRNVYRSMVITNRTASTMTIPANQLITHRSGIGLDTEVSIVNSRTETLFLGFTDQSYSINSNQSIFINVLVFGIIRLPVDVAPNVVAQRWVAYQSYTEMTRPFPSASPRSETFEVGTVFPIDENYDPDASGNEIDAPVVNLTDYIIHLQTGNAIGSPAPTEVDYLVNFM